MRVTLQRVDTDGFFWSAPRKVRIRKCESQKLKKKKIKRENIQTRSRIDKCSTCVGILSQSHIGVLAIFSSLVRSDVSPRLDAHVGAAPTTSVCFSEQMNLLATLQPSLGRKVQRFFFFSNRLFLCVVKGCPKLPFRASGGAA